MNALRYTLVTDGRSDSVLKPILDWLLIDLLENQGIQIAIQGTYADIGVISTPGLPGKIKTAVDLYPCDLLFIHRDAEKQSRQQRIHEIREAVATLPVEIVHDPVPIIPVRMTEAWLLISESAIRAAARNLNGNVNLKLPPFHCLESLPNPKQILHDLLSQASELRGRRLKDFNPRRCVHDITRGINDFSSLRQLSSFQALDDDLRSWLQRWIKKQSAL
jgi:hypothetical protein